MMNFEKISLNPPNYSKRKTMFTKIFQNLKRFGGSNPPNEDKLGSESENLTINDFFEI